MMSELTRLRDEALRLLTTYDEHKNSEDAILRRKAHLDLDKFLMENRETAIILMVKGLDEEIKLLQAKTVYDTVPKRRWFQRKPKVPKGGGVSADY